MGPDFHRHADLRPTADRIRCRATRDTVIGGRRLRAGDELLLPANDAKLMVWTGRIEVVEPVKGPSRIVTKDAFVGAERRALTVPFSVAKSSESTEVRRFTAIASTSVVDRSNDIVETGGWRLDAYRANPVILWGHDYSQMPVGRAKWIGVQGGQLVIEVEMASPGTSPQSDLAWNLIQQGMLRALSVGFRPLKWRAREDGPGIRFLEQELLEVSLVAVPANPEALLEPRVLPRARAVEPAILSATLPVKTESKAVEMEDVPRVSTDALRRRVVAGYRAGQTLERTTTLERLKKTEQCGRALLKATLAHGRGDGAAFENHMRIALAASPLAVKQEMEQRGRRRQVEKLKEPPPPPSPPRARVRHILPR